MRPLKLLYLHSAPMRAKLFLSWTSSVPADCILLQATQVPEKPQFLMQLPTLYTAKQAETTVRYPCFGQNMQRQALLLK